MMIVKKLRLQKCWSQEQLAEMTDLSIRTIQRVEKGKKPSMETLKALASVFEVDLLQLQTGETIMQSDKKITDNHQELSVKEDEAEALSYVKSLKEFFTHLFMFMVFSIVILIKKDITDMQFMVPLMMWAVGVLIHGLMAFEFINLDRFKLFSPNWEKKVIEKRIGRKL